MLSKSTLEKASRSFRFSALLVRAIRRFSRTSVSIEGQENLRSAPTLFVINHFTRLETGLLPQILHSYNEQMVHSLADSALFVGKFAQYLESVGAYPVDMPGRDEKIIAELMRGSHNWIIFPEGAMIKNKKVVGKGRFQLHLSDNIRSPHTGAATLALKCYLIKKEYKKALAENNKALIQYYESTYHLHGVNDLAPLDLCIIPVNITYYPLRPGKNLLSSSAHLLLKDLSPKLEEELLVEGKILLKDSDISVTFGRAIELHTFSKPYRRAFEYLLPFLSPKVRINWLVKLMGSRLTQLFMGRIYRRLSINMDHIIATTLRVIPLAGIDVSTFKKQIYLACISIKSRDQRRVHHSLNNHIINLITTDVYQPYDNFMALAFQEKVVSIKDKRLFVRKETLFSNVSFHRMRIDNMIAVLANEFEVMKYSVALIRKISRYSEKKLDQEVGQATEQRDRCIFEQERQRYSKEEYLQSKDAGKPRLFKGNKGKIGIVLAHGFLASPGEVSMLAQALNKLGYGVYCVRLVGHGTHPKALQDISLSDWELSYQRAYSILSQYHDQVLLAGFSAGALLALQKAAQGNTNILATVLINPAFKLHQKSASLSPFIEHWDQAMQYLSLPAGKFNYIENKTQYKDTNYTKMYISGVRCLTQLQEQSAQALDKIKTPLLIIQSDNDPIVDIQGAQQIIQKVASLDKQLLCVESADHHLIYRDEGKFIGQLIHQFIEKLEGVNAPD
ncbi:phospholipid/glycerol acyltransferase [Psychromonas sp. CNPT3]|uniref:alpha/beta fold hydrolase n=1 Tax=Psychromonas sp. CNPT3 TaxID=314282 RepID=UPI00006E76DC|nr:alpha/beta fold hydrolase [Psychromonas sp. CNPT3]AGH80142.1 phospholipid/glycerol acyltransferase [Psychromonas sp. CNPT3]